MMHEDDPPSESMSSFVSFESRYGTNASPLSSVAITLPSVKSERLMLPVSLSISPELPETLSRSEPARSTNVILPYCFTSSPVSGSCAPRKPSVRQAPAACAPRFRVQSRGWAAGAHERRAVDVQDEGGVRAAGVAVQRVRADLAVAGALLEDLHELRDLRAVDDEQVLDEETLRAALADLQRARLGVHQVYDLLVVDLKARRLERVRVVPLHVVALRHGLADLPRGARHEPFPRVAAVVALIHNDMLRTGDAVRFAAASLPVREHRRRVPVKSLEH